jgi:medium-chain acyl-[acyl-carrier-protein] hydrolase
MDKSKMSQAIASPSPFSTWFACHKPIPDARLRLFCFPYAGGAAAVFRRWSEGLPRDVEVCPVQFPGRGSRLMEPPFTALAPLVKALAEAIVPKLDKPFALFGHSLGALVCFELARELRRHGFPPSHLFVSAGRAPHLPRQGTPIYDLEEKAFLKELRRLNGTPEELLSNPELMEIVLPILRADFSIYETYAYSTEAPLDCPITSFGGLQDRRVSQPDLLAWRGETCGTFSLQLFNGDHFFLNTSLPSLLRAISNELHRDF